jgi:hypothetical protein
MGRVKIPYYVVVKGRGYWRPHPRMRPFGFQIVRCGADGPDAWALAQSWNERWQAVRNGNAPPLIDPSKLTRDEAEAARRYPSGSVGAAFQVYIRTEEWAAKAYSNRIKVWWPAWYRIREMWGDVAPDTISFEQISRWRAALERKYGRGVAHKTIKVWRSLWTVMLAMKVARTADPSRGVRNKAPLPRYQRWGEGEAVRLVKCAWRAGYRGLACVIAVCWDTQFSPVDARTLRARHKAQDNGRLFFDRQEDGRTKTGRAAIGTLSKRTERLVATYLASLGVDLLPDAVLFRNRSGNPYREDTLGDDFASWTCGAPEWWRRLPATPGRSHFRPSSQTQFSSQMPSTGHMRRSISRPCGVLTRLGCGVGNAFAKGTKQGEKYQLNSPIEYDDR